MWIDDGDPWWLSPNIWVVSSDDPNDPPGLPVEGVSSYLWAKVVNRGSSPVSDVTVRYWWADPSTAITRLSARLIGTSNASLAPGEIKEILCLVPWVPEIVNDGHECLIAEATAPSDPVPPHTPSDSFDVPSIRQVAQRNISVIAATTSMMVHSFMIGNGGYGEKVLLTARRGKLAMLKPLAAAIGLREQPHEAPEFAAMGIGAYRCGEQIDEVPGPDLELRVPRGTRRRMALIADTERPFPDGTAALLLIEQCDEREQVMGGIAILAVAGDLHRRLRPAAPEHREDEAYEQAKGVGR